MPIPENFTAPNRISAKERAFNQIQEWIIDGTLQPKEKLNDADLAESLGVSRTPIREALQLLAVQGFVEMQPGVATQVTSINKEDISKILPPLAVLQALAAELATPVLSQHNIDSLRQINSEFSQAIGEGNYYSALKMDEQFHEVIVDVVRNPYLNNTITMLQAHVRRLFFHKSIILTPDSIEEHEAILRAFECQDSETASRIARNNWLRPIEVYYSYLKDNR
ncbi:GntR family transcriptional regulator [Sporomusa acidovorans]|uniref:HTH-type transcriptional regulator LutR n=1 Tax=Sporomusa acidovorans (strain ATCC 49682 / DSM 3132 / Mol) TaxID=1123286 RepID=A0ABZ3J4R4_SPOA4|nr:GntR family transcriptional regulator [Sporomusa acidovorans]OZC18088.1 HTH-type transcriptional regulator LutR [Sporomusa acidovorans DSM 3132]SDF78202.1 DNA-binding transcriptional regulator, GntR family [Sporomusa acidovorans]